MPSDQEQEHQRHRRVPRGLSKEEALKKIEAFAAHLAGYWEKDGHDMMVYRTERCISFRKLTRWEMQSAGTTPILMPATIPTEAHNTTNCVVQVILRLYNTVSEVLHGFDLGSSACAWDGKEAYLSSIGDFRRVRRERRRHDAPAPELEYRIEKYFDRGFGLVLPDLDVGMARAAFESNKPYFYTFIKLGFVKIRLTKADATARFIPVDAIIGVRGPESEKKALPNVFEAREITFLRIAERESLRDGVSGRTGASTSLETKAATTSVSTQTPSPVSAPASVLAQAPDEDPEIKAEYGGIHYYNSSSIGVKNFVTCCKRPVRTAALCGFAKYTPGMNLSTVKVTFDGLADSNSQLARRDKLQVGELESLLGKSVANSIAGLVIEGKEVGFGALAVTLGDAMSGRGRIPFEFQPVEEGTALIMGGVFRALPTTIAGVVRRILQSSVSDLNPHPRNRLPFFVFWSRACEQCIRELSPHWCSYGFDKGDTGILCVVSRVLLLHQ